LIRQTDGVGELFRLYIYSPTQFQCLQNRSICGHLANTEQEHYFFVQVISLFHIQNTHFDCPEVACQGSGSSPMNCMKSADCQEPQWPMFAASQARHELQHTCRIGLESREVV